MSSTTADYPPAVFARDAYAHAVLELAARSSYLTQKLDVELNPVVLLYDEPTKPEIACTVTALSQFGLLSWEHRDTPSTQYPQLTGLGEWFLARWDAQLGGNGQ